ncbi:hypothetical protein DBU29_000240 [Escherichia coli O25]|nr:hypothetical protein [Escherichia coli O25]HAH9618817.1 hypothetical protein [Escherichia coli]
MFPAPAGINRPVDLLPWLAWGVPRASGDKPQPAEFENVEPVCSPRQRG